MNQTNRFRHGLLAFSLAALSVNSTSLLAQDTNAADSSQQQLCSYDKSMPIIPDGNIATKDELIAAQTRIKAFQDRLQKFRDCLDVKLSSLDAESEDYEASKASFHAQRNDSISLEEKVAAKFNEAIGIYKSR